MPKSQQGGETDPLVSIWGKRMSEEQMREVLLVKDRPKFLVQALSGLIAGLFAGCASSGPREEVRFIYLDWADTLQVVFRYSGDPRYEMSSPSLADAMRDQRERYFERAIHTVLPIANLPMGYRVLEERESAVEGQPVLRIHALRWDVDQLGQLEAVIRVTLEAYGERNELGTYTHREPISIALPADRRDQDFTTAMIKALTQMMSDLVEHIESPVEPIDIEYLE